MFCKKICKNRTGVRADNKIYIMRRAYQDYGFIIENEKFLGVSLGFDFCAEHEWGTDDMKRVLQIPELSRKTAGIKSRTISVKKPENIFFYKEDGLFTWLYMGKKWPWDEVAEDRMPTYCLKTDELNWVEKDNKRIVKENSQEKQREMIITAWDSHEFGMIVKGKKEREMIKELYEAILKSDCAISYLSLSGNNPFSRSSLSVLIISKLDEQILKQMKDADTEHLDLKDVENKFNIYEKLKKTKKFGEYSLHYCGPKFLAYGESKEIIEAEKKKYNTKYEVIYLLNSSELYGWFTLEQLTKLIKDKKFAVEDLKKEK